ncbi:MAG TPA: alpha/beta fold hydrolase [Gaiellaceae bacterium]|nr:alpha/beta fold hydrolase [Gaiellaceae bacterium]
MLARLVILGSLLAVGSGAGGGLTAAHPCPGQPGYTCSTLRVPLDHTGRRPGTLALQVATANNANAPRGDLLLLAGGPGQAGVPLLDRVPRILGAELRDYRVVVFDQRGTGAGALNCAAMQAAMGSSDLFPPPAAAVRACTAKLGDRRQFFGSDDVVADMESLRAALGVKTWVVDGISYGTYVAERYALAHPTHVSKIVLDSVVPHEGEFDLGLDEFRATTRVLNDACGCAADLAAAVKRYDAGPALFDAVTFLSIADPTFMSMFKLPEVLRDQRQLEQMLALVRSYEQTPASSLDQGLHASALCADWRYPWGDSAAPLAGRTSKLAAAVAKLPANSLYPYNRRTARDNGIVQQCLPWAPTAATPAPRGKIRVPSLLLAGSHDLSTPLEWARKELALTTRGTLVVVPGAGHSVQSRAQSEIGRSAVARFLLG